MPKRVTKHDGRTDRGHAHAVVRDAEPYFLSGEEQTNSVASYLGSRSSVVQSRSEAYRRAAERAHQQAKGALSPQEEHLLLEVERSLRRLAELEEWQSTIDSDKKQPERPFAFFELFRGGRER
jgi:hypothetical protein